MLDAGIHVIYKHAADAGLAKLVLRERAYFRSLYHFSGPAAYADANAIPV
jgi:hypothetical protein